MRKEFLGGVPRDEKKVVETFCAHNRENALKTKPKVRLLFLLFFSKAELVQRKRLLGVFSHLLLVVVVVGVGVGCCLDGHNTRRPPRAL